MPALLDTLDRFNHTSSSIRSLTHTQPPSTDPGPFTAAILQLSPQDLLRDADEAEYGLFTFLKDSSDTPLEGLAAQGKVGRREFRGATPLRGKRVRAAMINEDEPEVYVEAASKYLDRFHAIQPMPNARTQLEILIDRLNNVRDSIDKLQASLDQSAQDGRASPRSQAAEEERRISELKSRILQLRKRKEALTSKLPARSTARPRGAKSTRLGKISTKVAPARGSLDSPSSVVSTPASQGGFKPSRLPHAQGSSRVPGPPKGKSISLEEPTDQIVSEKTDEAERLFWSGGKPSKLGSGDPNQSNSLLDEKLDMSEFDALMSPTPTRDSSRTSLPLDDSTAEQLNAPISDVNIADVDEDEDGNDEDEDSGEPTIVVSKLAPSQSASPPTATPPSPPPSRPSSQSARPEPQTPVQDDKVVAAPPSTKTKVKRVRVTAEVERVCTKIWNTIPDLLVPGNNFSSPGKKPPNAKDTLAVLQAIAAQPIPGPSTDPVSSPSTRSTLSSLLGIETLGPAGGSPHQIMTAHVLLSLLTAPNHAMPLTALKALLASKTAVPSPGPDAGREARQGAAALSASAAQAGTRALYGCVAKKLVKIDRGGGEQVVKFD